MSDLSAGTAVLVAVVGGVGGFAGSSLSALVTDRGRRRDRREDRQLDSARAMGPVLAYLVDSDPERVGFNASPDPAQNVARLTELFTRRDQLRGELLVLAAGHPAESVRGVARDLEGAIYNALLSCTLFVNNLPGGGYGSERYHKAAVDDHQKAQWLAELLLKEIAYQGRGPRLRDRLPREIPRVIRLPPPPRFRGGGR